ncbi:hypothetical protein [Streptomyces chartreusis]|uniref:hypothetical protein n=1 Tax=Streptomyces chartreusis TaxID=1969 RepID=UPI00382B458B
MDQIRIPRPSPEQAARVRAAYADAFHAIAVAARPVFQALAVGAAEIGRAWREASTCRAGSTAPNAIGNEHCTLTIGHEGRHQEGTLTWPNNAAPRGQR